MHGGIFHSCCSLTVTLRLGECMTGAGGDGGPFGIFLFVLQQQQQYILKQTPTNQCILSIVKHTQKIVWQKVPVQIFQHS